jgi:two-component system, OmpR family, alkaline phosphatase synthesis response regulator PhoP
VHKPIHIVFLDNRLQDIFASFQVLETEFQCVKMFTHEKDFFDFMQTNTTHIILMNLDIAPRDAISILNDIRSNQGYNSTSVVVYSQKQDDFIQELVLDSGADSFITFHQKPEILRLFLRNLLKRRLKPAEPRKMIFIDYEKHLVYYHNKAITMPRKEFLMFSLFYNNPHTFFSKAEIAIRIWNNVEAARRRTIDVHIYKIRQFLGRHVIQSKKGHGYRLNIKL